MPEANPIADTEPILHSGVGRVLHYEHDLAVQWDSTAANYGGSGPFC